MLDIERIKERLTRVDEDGLQDDTWPMKDTWRDTVALVEEIERLRSLVESHVLSLQTLGHETPHRMGRDLRSRMNGEASPTP